MAESGPGVSPAGAERRLVMDVHEIPAGPNTNVCVDAVVTAVVDEQARLRPLRVEVRRILDRAACGASRPDDATSYRRARLVLRMHEVGWRRTSLPHGAALALARRTELVVPTIVDPDAPAA